MRLQIFFLRPPKSPYFIGEDEAAERFSVTFEGKVLPDAEKYECVADTTIYPTSGSTFNEVLNDLWKQTQNDFYENGWRPQMVSGSTPCRSSMVGDLFCIGNVCYVVKGMGFEAVPDDVAQKILQYPVTQ